MKKGDFNWSVETIIVIVLAVLLMVMIAYIILKGGLNLVK